MGKIREFFLVFWKVLSGNINVQTFIWLALMVPEVIRGGVPKDPWIGLMSDPGRSFDQI